jgi:hypothetical protein
MLVRPINSFAESTGSIRATHRNGRYEDRDIDLIVAPGMPGGNTGGMSAGFTAFVLMSYARFLQTPGFIGT